MANEARHTPGPWTCIEDYYSDSAVVVDAGGFKHVEAHNPVAVLLDYQNRLGIAHWADSPRASREIGLDEQLANARLIAASPDLLQAAEQFLASVKDGNVADLIDYYADIFGEAVAKATGSPQ